MRQVKYAKRYRMELDLRLPRPRAELPRGFEWVDWSLERLEQHAQVKFACFAGGTDARVFPSLGRLNGCRDLMHAIAGRPGFCPAATWLVRAWDEPVGTVQGLRDTKGVGGIQNLGVLPGYRGRGLGRALLLKALEGFTASGCRRAFLEVTADNAGAIHLYRELGFRNYRTMYRELPAAEADRSTGSPGVIESAGVGQ